MFITKAIVENMITEVIAVVIYIVFAETNGNLFFYLSFLSLFLSLSLFLFLSLSLSLSLSLLHLSLSLSNAHTFFKGPSLYLLEPAGGR